MVRGSRSVREIQLLLLSFVYDGIPRDPYNPSFEVNRANLRPTRKSLSIVPRLRKQPILLALAGSSGKEKERDRCP
ncbi:2004_t:CDS:2 [Acaulospora colombiana]|uniref:2004_t:CDS:1 n=1 Tax=Acaulospora colombiana TaxID=27376 RepID=A0ACA9L1Y7_9GLOM|nr:2004_t:CDS:2 [Acaulospora colombiana]